MVGRLDDTEDRRPGDRPPDDSGQDRRLEDRHPEVESAEFEAEQPARHLTGLPKLVVSVAAVAVSLYALLWVVRPQPAQPYRTSFLAVTLAMTLLFDRKDALGEVHPSARRLELETAPKVAPLELHPGARRYYDEQAKT